MCMVLFVRSVHRGNTQVAADGFAQYVPAFIAASRLMRAMVVVDLYFFLLGEESYSGSRHACNAAVMIYNKNRVGL